LFNYKPRKNSNFFYLFFILFYIYAALNWNINFLWICTLLWWMRINNNNNKSFFFAHMDRGNFRFYVHLFCQEIMILLFLHSHTYIWIFLLVELIPDDFVLTIFFTFLLSFVFFYLVYIVFEMILYANTSIRSLSLSLIFFLYIYI